MTDYQKLVDIFLDELPEEHPWIGNIKGVVDRLIAEGVTFATDNNVGHKWIPVSERLPEDDGWYLCYIRPYGFRGVAYHTILPYDQQGFRTGYVYTDDVTHWMPLPEPPKGE